MWPRPGPAAALTPALLGLGVRAAGSDPGVGVSAVGSTQAEAAPSAVLPGFEGCGSGASWADAGLIVVSEAELSHLHNSSRKTRGQQVGLAAAPLESRAMSVFSMENCPEGVAGLSVGASTHPLGGAGRTAESSPSQRHPQAWSHGQGETMSLGAVPSPLAPCHRHGIEFSFEVPESPCADRWRFRAVADKAWVSSLK